MIYRSLVSPETQIQTLEAPIRLESGEVLRGIDVAYRTWGTPESEAILVCHALTGSADADDWWETLFRPGGVCDPADNYVIASNVLAGCYGTTGPTTLRPGSGVHWGADFPQVTIRDMVTVQARLLEALGVERLRLIVGGSMGGMQVLEWAAMFPERVQAIAPVCTSGAHSAWCIGISEAQRQAIRADRNWSGGFYRLGSGPRHGLAAARAMALISYRSQESFTERFARQVRTTEALETAFEVENYLRYQGSKLVQRFDANTYIRLTEAMDSHDLGRGRDRPWQEVAAELDSPALVVGVRSDQLYVLGDQEELAEALPQVQFEIIEAPHGHDAFLMEIEWLDRCLLEFLRGVEGSGRRKRRRNAS